MTELHSVYELLRTQLQPQTNRRDSMQLFVDVLWDGLREHDVSWLGFYLDQPAQPEDRRIVLGPHRDSPACSPIGVHGVCGDALSRRTTVIVADVRDLGDAYVACNPRDRAEIVVPLVDGNACWGVLDLDSFSIGRFTQTDRMGLHGALRAIGFQPADEDEGCRPK